MSENKKDCLGQCSICHLSILYVDDYVIVQDFIKGLKQGEFYYHRQCFRDRLNGTKKLEAYAYNILGRANEKMKELGI